VVLTVKKIFHKQKTHSAFPDRRRIMTRSNKLAAMTFTALLSVTCLFYGDVFAQSACDNCQKPMVVLYGIKMNVSMPPADDSLGQYTTSQSQQAFLSWLDLGDAMVAMAQISTNDPDNGCVDWLDGTMAQELAANPDTNVIMHVENYSTGDLPPSGKVDGVDFVIWGEIDSSGGQYQVSVYLEDACSRARIASGQAAFSNPKDAESSCATAASQIEPVINRIRDFQKMKRSTPGIAIDAKLDVIPSKETMKGNETIPVSFNLHDCDGTALPNNYIRISASNGHFDHDSVKTDDSGNATANFTAGNVQDLANITATFYPYQTPTCKTRGSWGDTTVDINSVPNRNWVVNIKGNYNYNSSVTDNSNGASYSATQVTHSDANVTQYIVGDLTDTSVSIDEVVGGKGTSTITGTSRTVESSQDSYSLDLITSSAVPSQEEDFTSPTGLGDLGTNQALNGGGGITFGLELSMDLKQNWYSFSESKSSGAYTFDTLIEFDPSPDPYQVFHTQPSTYFGPANSTWTKTDSGFIFEGTTVYDTTSHPTSTRAETSHRDDHVTVYVKPYKNPTGVKAIGNGIPTRYELSQNFPNPFNPTTMIGYQLPAASHVTLKVYDILGREVATLVDQKQNPGKYGVKFDGSHLSSGVYLYRLSAGSYTATKKLVLLK
jgi:hypothetical protein